MVWRPRNSHNRRLWLRKGAIPLYSSSWNCWMEWYIPLIYMSIFFSIIFNNTYYSWIHIAFHRIYKNNVMLTLIWSLFFFIVLKMSSAFYICCTYSGALQTRFFHRSKQCEAWLDYFKGSRPMFSLSLFMNWFQKPFLEILVPIPICVWSSYKYSYTTI